MANQNGRICNAQRELEVMKRLSERAEAAEGSPGSHQVVQLPDYFEHTGPNGTHLCLVLELMWGDIISLFRGYRNSGPESTLPLVKVVARQLLQGLEHLEACGVIHNGIHRSSSNRRLHQICMAKTVSTPSDRS